MAIGAGVRSRSSTHSTTGDSLAATIARTVDLPTPLAPVTSSNTRRLSQADGGEPAESALITIARVLDETTECEARAGMTPESFAQRFRVPVRIHISAVHGF